MKKIYLIILVALSIFVLSWFLPWLYSIIFPVGGSDPFVAYSPVSNQMIVSEIGDGSKTEIYAVDSEGNPTGEVYTKSDRDSLLPQIYFTQLMAQERMPDTIAGIEMTVPALKHGQWVFSSLPRDINKVFPDVYLIMESMPERIDLEDPTEVFRFRNGEVEFVDMATNSVVEGRSRRFTEIFKSRDFKFPLKSFSANITSRKPYDEGYLMVDDAGDIYHLKMRAGRPYMMKVQKADSVRATHVFVMENVDTRHLGLVTDEANRLYILEHEGYRLIPLEVGEVDPRKDRISVVKNLFNWVVKITDNDGVRWTVLDAETYAPLARYSRIYTESTSEKVASFIFPFTLSFTDISDCYAFPRFADVSWRAFFLNILLSLILLVSLRRGGFPWRCSVGGAVITLFCGIFSFIPMMLIRN